jgi:hypothetical protein
LQGDNRTGLSWQRILFRSSYGDKEDPATECN